MPEQTEKVALASIVKSVVRVCAVDFAVIALAGRDGPSILAQNGAAPSATDQLLNSCIDTVVRSRTGLEIDDIQNHPQLAAALSNTAHFGARFCAARPLLTPDGHAVGALCLIDQQDRVLSDAQHELLDDMTRTASALLEQKQAMAAARSALDKAQYAAEMANEAAETQNTHFSIALKYMSQGLCMFDGDERLVVSNDRYAEMYGLSPDLMKPGVSFRKILDYRISNNAITGDDPEQYIAERVAAVRENTRSTKIQLMSDGRVLAISHAPLPGGGWVATHEDISELAKAEAMNQRLARIVEDAINEIYVFDAETLKFLQVNKSACNNLGYSLDELRNLTPIDIKPEHTRESFEDVISPLRRGDTSHALFETVHERKDGSFYNVRVTLQLIESQNQQVLTAIIEDVTERNEVLHDLKQNKELFSRAFHANPLPYTISGPDGAIYDINDAWMKMMGYSREEAVGNSAYKLGLWADAEDRAKFVSLLEKNRTVDNYETQYRTKTGELRDVLVSGEWVDVRGKPRMFNISHDVTEHKETERRLLEDRDMLKEMVREATADLEAKAQELAAALAKEKELNELQRQFVSMASHEFRTPLAIIDATAQRLKKRADSMSSDDAINRIEKIRQAVARMTQLMESTLTAARLEDGRVAVDIKPCAIEQIVLDVCSRHQDIAKNHVISCEMSNLPETIKADARALEQILTNLLSNAIKYSPESPDVRVNAYRSGKNVVIKVADQGVGIDEEDLPNMFGRFFRAKTSTGIAGTGIGLNLVKTLADMHGGSVSVESTKGVGSTFIVILPIDGVAAPDKPQDTAA
ncbi:MAG: PAS domain S-box protein [Hyphomicrobiaceae bacterium]|nr:PAS domain S-box protein [Hyphomicrobiaceae bacterium]